MKARIKATGEVVDVQWDSAYAREYYDTHFWYSPERNLHFHERELDFMEDKEIDWEQRTWDAAVAIMQGFVDSLNFRENSADLAIKYAKALVAQYRNGK